VAQAFLALGDSYTIGEGIAEDGRWPVQLAAALRAQGVPLDPPRIIATTGWTTAELDAGIDTAHAQAPIAGDHAVVSLLAGVNDQYRGLEPEGFGQRFAALLRRAAGFAGGDASRVLVLSIPDWGVTPFALAQGRDPGVVARQIDAFNAICHARATAAGARWVDITPASRRHGAEAGMLADDGLHPSAAMYALWSTLALPAAQAALGARRTA